MKKFRFEQILRVKEQIEEKKKNELKLQYELLNRYLNSKVQIQNQIDTTKHKLSQTMLNGFLPTDIKYYNHFLLTLKKNLEIQNQLIYYQELKVEKKKEELIESMKDKKKYERLKEKFLIKLKDQIKKNEENELDRIVSYKIYRKLGDDNG